MVLTGVSTYIEDNSPHAVWRFLKLILYLFSRIWALLSTADAKFSSFSLVPRPSIESVILH